MKKRILAIVITVLLLAFSAPASATSQDDTSQQRKRRNDPIWQGLLAGANFDFDYLDRRSNQTAPDTTPLPMPPRKKPTPSPERVEYAALGDSIAAGVGLDSQGQCDRSTQAYPYRVAAARGLKLTHIACSGATLGDLFTAQHISGPNPPPQIQAAFAGGTPELITITAGANDVQWVRFLGKCYAGTCGTTTDERIASGLRTALDIKLGVLFRSIERRSQGSPPEVIMTGYYNPLSPECSAAEPRVTPEEITWLGEQIDALNQTLEDAAASRGYIRFVPISFEGHGICSADPWVQGLNDPAPFHPTARGQRAIANAIL
jgi:lysophospholipase L1-like esterase